MNKADAIKVDAGPERSMGRLAWILIPGLAVSALMAAPVTLTFRGKVVEIRDPAHILPESDLEAGDSVEYRFLIDREKKAVAFAKNGKTIRYGSGFFAEFLGDLLLPDPDPGAKADSADPAGIREYNLGGPNMALRGNGSDHPCEVAMVSGSWDNPALGDSLAGTETVYGRVGKVKKPASVVTGLKLVAIGGPEPAEALE